MPKFLKWGGKDWNRQGGAEGGLSFYFSVCSLRDMGLEPGMGIRGKLATKRVGRPGDRAGVFPCPRRFGQKSRFTKGETIEKPSEKKRKANLRRGPSKLSILAGEGRKRRERYRNLNGKQGGRGEGVVCLSPPFPPKTQERFSGRGVSWGEKNENSYKEKKEHR